LTERGDQTHPGGKVFSSGYLCLECRNPPQYFFTTNASEDYQYKREEEGLERRFSETISVDRKGRRRDSVFINDGPDMLPFEGLGNISFSGPLMI
jgi:hypothetical protein